MSHYDESTLALLALGESAAAADGGAHLVECARCRDEVASLAAVVAVGRATTEQDRPVAPPDAVWDRIRTELAADAQGPAAGAAPLGRAAARNRRSSTRGIGPALLVAAAVVGLLVGVLSTWVVLREPAATPAASGRTSVATLDPLDAPQARGTAVLTVLPSDARTMTVTVDDLAHPPGTFYEVWLMDPAAGGLVSLGVLGPDGHGEFTVPVGLDLERYSAVDVSLQPLDGSPLHSKNSAVRGTLTA